MQVLEEGNRDKVVMLVKAGVPLDISVRYWMGTQRSVWVYEK